MSQNEDNASWETVTSKKTIRKEKLEQNRLRLEQTRMKRDLRYLQTHVGFQKHRITRDSAIDIIANADDSIKTGITLNSLFIVSNGRCVGHLICVSNSNKNLNCMQCKWTADSGFSTHCCCTDDVLFDLPVNFYLGCDGYLNDYLDKMLDKPLEESDIVQNVESDIAQNVETV